MLTRTQKQEQVEELREKLGRATSIFLADYRGVDVESVNKLRRQLHAGDFEYRVVKNSVLRRAAEGNDLAHLREQLAGPTAIALSFGDPVGLAKALLDYAKDHEVFELKAGVFEGRALEQSEIATLATLPTLDEARAQLAGLLQAPAQKLAAVLQAPAGQLARVMGARRSQLEEQGGT